MKNSSIAAAMFLVVLPVTAQISPGPASQPPVSSKFSTIVVPEMNLEGTEPTMFATLVREAGLSGGVGTSRPDCSPEPGGSASIAAGTRLGNALAEIAKYSPKPEWRVQDGVANFFPGGAIPLMLQTQVRAFGWDKATPFMEVLGRLRGLPEVAEAASRLGLREAPFEGGSSAICVRGDCAQEVRPKTAPETAIEIERNTPLLEVLNQIARAHRGAVWNYVEYHCDKGTLFSLSAIAE
jgi:hypothetical protein